MLDLVKNLLDKVFSADNPGIRKIPASVPEAVHPADLVLAFAGFIHDVFVYSLALPSVYSSCLINELPIFADNLGRIELIPLLQSEIQR